MCFIRIHLTLILKLTIFLTPFWLKMRYPVYNFMNSRWNYGIILKSQALRGQWSLKNMKLMLFSFWENKLKVVQNFWLKFKINQIRREHIKTTSIKSFNIFFSECTFKSKETFLNSVSFFFFTNLIARDAIISLRIIFLCKGKKFNLLVLFKRKKLFSLGNLINTLLFFPKLRKEPIIN